MRGHSGGPRASLRWGALLLGASVLGSCAEPAAPALVVPLQTEPVLAVELTFGERTAWFMFDTGAGAHTLARWFVDAAGLTVDADAPEDLTARDVTGATVRLHVVTDPVATLPGGAELGLGSAIVADFPPHFEETETGGLINPQLLAGPGRAAVLDLRVPELRIEPFDDAVRRLGARLLSPEEVDVCIEDDAPVANLVYAVKVRRDGREGRLQLDTGAGTTSIGAASPLVDGLPLEEGGRTMGVGGRARSYSLARGVTLSVAGYRATVDAQVVESTQGGCGPDGVLGRDVLGDCGLVLGDSSVALACP